MTSHTNRTTWEPHRTWAFVVGVLEWKHADIYESFPQTQRRDATLVKLLEERGVPQSQIRYLRDKQATTDMIESRLNEMLRAAAPGDTLLLYYCGHGSLEESGSVFFASYDAGDDDNNGWSADSLIDTIDTHFGGTQAILIADCCHSGHLTDLVKRHKGRIAYAVLGSSLASELSTGNWTFTEALLAGLRGEAFTDEDASDSISLAELAAHIEVEMAFAEEQVATFAVSPGFNPQLVIAAAQPRRDPLLGKNVVVQADDAWYRAQIIDVRGKRMKVRYYGYNSDDDEWVEPEQVRTLGRPRYPVGSTVEVESKRRWYLATILEERAGIHLISYEGYDSDTNEWVGSRRIRPLV